MLVVVQRHSGLATSRQGKTPLRRCVAYYERYVAYYEPIRQGKMPLRHSAAAWLTTNEFSLWRPGVKERLRQALHALTIRRCAASHSGEVAACREKCRRTAAPTSARVSAPRCLR